MTNNPHSSQRVHNDGDGPVIANQGGNQTVYMESVKDHLQNGLMALKGRMYAKAVTELEDFLADARKVGADKLPEAQRDLATGHFHAALAMLHGRPPNDRSPEEIDRLENHLDQAIGYGDVVVTHQANVLWAIVKDDYYSAFGMAPRPPAAAELAVSIGELRPSDVEPLVTHVRRAQGRTWAAMMARAAEFGLTAPPESVQAQVVRDYDPAREDAVRRYFVRTPRFRSPVPGIAAMVTAAVCVLLGVAAQSAATVVLVVAAYFVGKWGWEKDRQYRRYLKRYAAAEPKPTDAQMDHWLAADVAALQVRAGRQVRLVAVTKHEGGDLVYPVQAVVGMPSPEGKMVDSLRIRRGGDSLWRANQYDVLILFLTNDLISLYRCTLDFHTGEPVYEEITEWHYRDIVGVSTNRITMPAQITALFRKYDEMFEHDVDADNEKYADIPFAQAFTISIVNGERIALNTGFGENIGAGNEIAWRDNERALDIIKKMVRARHASG